MCVEVRRQLWSYFSPSTVDLGINLGLLIKYGKGPSPLSKPSIPLNHFWECKRVLSKCMNILLIFTFLTEKPEALLSKRLNIRFNEEHTESWKEFRSVLDSVGIVHIKSLRPLPREKKKYMIILVLRIICLYCIKTVFNFLIFDVLMCSWTFLNIYSQAHTQICKRIKLKAPTKLLSYCLSWHKLR